MASWHSAGVQFSESENPPFQRDRILETTHQNISDHRGQAIRRKPLPSTVASAPLLSLPSQNEPRRTYRVQKIPPCVDAAQLAEFLADASESLGPAENIAVFSIATSLGSESYASQVTKTATVSFIRTPQILDNDEDHWSVVCGHPKWDRKLDFDIHFRGFTPLNDVCVDEQQLDCIAISGLASHPFGSWKLRDSGTNFMWLRDQLPKDLPFVRSIIYGYETKLVGSQSFRSINDLALGFIGDLRTIRKSVCNALAFFAHSLGGIVLKRAIVSIATSGTGEDEILRRIRMICFFGVPSHGMHIEHLLAMVKEQPNQGLVESLSTESRYLPELDIQFSGLAAFRAIRFISVYETRQSLTTKQIEPGKWIRSEPYQILVEKSSAIQRGTAQLDIFPVDQDHSNMVKFAENDQAYQTICTFVREARSSRSIADIAMGRTAPNSWDTTGHGSLRDLIESLNISDTRKREGQIEKAYLNTFEWVYRKPDIGLGSWLVRDDNMFWIRGKPGSGKSTLMKYLQDSEETHECIYPQQHRRTVICCWFFFYARGTPLQKSFEGLLHSILYQIVLGDSRLATLILPLFRKLQNSELSVRAAPTQRGSWPLEALQTALNIILQQNIFPLRLYLFLDALDEYAGRPEVLAEFLTSVSSPRAGTLTQVKICFSSRPWNVFVKNFDRCPGFSIHNHTKEDIRAYTEGELAKQFINDPESKVKELTLAIVEKANGVFLWVRLVMDDLLQHATDGASLVELHAILKSMPEELEDFYEMIIQRIPPAYLVEAYNMMEVVLRSNTSLSLEQYAVAIACAPYATMAECRHQIQISQSSSARQSLARKIESRCGGLLEIVELIYDSDSPEDNNLKLTLVQFMHQTVQEVVSKPGFRQRMLGIPGTSMGHNGHSILAKYHLTAATTFLGSRSDLSQGMLHARLSESTTGLDQAEFLNSIGKDTFKAWVEDCLAYAPFRPNTVLALAVAADLRLYVAKELDKKPRLVNMHPEISLLHVAIQHTSLNQRQPNDALTINPNFSLGPMCEILLKRGAWLHSDYKGIKPFQMLLEHYWNDLCQHCPSVRANLLFEVVRSFLEAGQDPNIDITQSSYNGGGSCKPLHICSSLISSLLLQHGAAVNALNSEGRTALDMSVSRFHIQDVDEDAIFGPGGSFRRPDEAFETTMILMEYGGRVTREGMACLPIFLRNLERFYPIPQDLRDMTCLPLFDTDSALPGRYADINTLPLHASFNRLKPGASQSSVSPSYLSGPQIFELEGTLVTEWQNRRAAHSSRALGWFSKAFKNGRGKRNQGTIRDI